MKVEKRSKEMDPAMPVWISALDCLEAGRKEEALDRVQKALAAGEFEGPGTSSLAGVDSLQLSLDRWVVELLDRLLDGSGPNTSLPPTPSLSTEASSEQRLAWDVGCALQAILNASWNVRSGEVSKMVDSARLAAAKAPNRWAWVHLRVASVLQASFRFTGEPYLFEEAVAACRLVVDRVDRPHIAVPGRGLLANLYLLTGRFHRCVEHCDAAIELAIAMGMEDGSSSAMAHQFKGYVLFEWGQMTEAKQELTKAWELAGDPGTGVRTGVARVMASLCAALGNLDDADRWMTRLVDAMHQPMTLRNREWLAAVRVRHDADHRRDIRAIDTWQRAYQYDADTLSNLPEAEIPARLHEYEHLLAMLEASRQWGTVLRVSDTVLRGCGETRTWFRVRALTTKAVALEALGFSSEADQIWTEALSGGHDGSFVRVYVTGSALRQRLLGRAAKVSSTQGHVDRIANMTGGSFLNLANQVLLTPKQLEVLREVAAGRSNRQIAEELGVTVPTVKTHLREIFVRLEVSSRTQAVAKSHELGLI